jgi:hypothetical protein
LPTCCNEQRGSNWVAQARTDEEGQLVKDRLTSIAMVDDIENAGF